MQSQTPTIRIAIYDGDTVVREEVFTRKLIRIGKAGQNHLQLDDTNVSREHAHIEVSDSGKVRLIDMESTNGTTVNGNRVTTVDLRPGDVVVVGGTKLVVDFEMSAAAQGTETFLSGQVDPALASGRYGFEGKLLWGDRVLGWTVFPAGATVTMGEAEGADFFVPEGILGTSKFTLATPAGDDYLLDVTSAKFDGEFLVDDKIVRLPEMERRGKVEQGKYVRLDGKTTARLRAGDFTLLAGRSQIPKKIKGSWWKRYNMRDHVYLMISLILHLLFMVLVTLVPEEQLKAVRDPYDRNTQAMKKIQVAVLERKIEEEKKQLEEEEMRKRLEKATQRDEGSSLSIAPRNDKEITSKLVTPDIQERNKQVADTALTRVMGANAALLDRVLEAAGPGLGGGTMGIRTIGDRGIDAELAMGLDAFGGTLGAGGGGFAGTGAWGGGSDFGPADLRGIAGLGKDDAEGAASRVRFKGAGDPRVVTGPVSVEGELDRETVRRYIQSKLDQIRFCYQKEVQTNPDLAGQVKAEWVILPTGNVAQVRISQSSLGSNAVESCVVSRIQTWRFPSPKGGGTVRVSYPFIFKVTK
ncbi:MAG TPA: TonB family protein [Myxococcota bacterium]|jgi:TonB family protein|nr:TonB family protein [Myxococcota bacterium]